MKAKYPYITLPICLIIGLVAIMVMIGWVSHNLLLVQFYSTFAPMQFNTALCFLLTCFALATLHTSHRYITQAFSILVLLFATITFSQYIFGVNYGIDTLIISPFTNIKTPYIGRMAPNTALNFIMISSALFFSSITNRWSQWKILLVAFVGSIIMAISLIPVIAYLTGVESPYFWTNFTQMAIHTSSSFFILGFVLILYAWYQTETLPLWLPFPIFLSLIIISFSIAQAIKSSQEENLQEITDVELSHIGVSIQQSLEDIYSALNRIKKRRMINENISLKIWEKDAQEYLKSYPFLHSIHWMDTTSHIVASSKTHFNVNSKILTSEDFKTHLQKAQITQQAQITKVIELDQDKKGYIYINPLIINNLYKGALIAVFNLDALLIRLLPSWFLDQHLITVKESEDVIFSNLLAYQTHDDRWKKTTFLENLNTIWQLNISPKQDLIASQVSYLPEMIVVIGFIISLLTSISILLMMKWHQNNDTLRFNEERLNLALSGTSDGLWDWNVVTREVYYSSRFFELVGYKPGELPNVLQTFINLLHPDDYESTFQQINQHFETGIPYNTDYRLKHKDDYYIWFNARGQAIWNDQGQPIRMAGFITDITSRKDIDQMKNEFISTVSHELRTPLTSIRGSLGLILTETLGELPEKMKNFLDIAYRNSERLILLINDILDMEKIESGKMHFDLKWYNLKDLIHQTVDLHQSYGEKYQVKFIVKKSIADIQVFVDNDRFNQVMANLLSNAAKFSPPQSNVEISVEEKKNTVIVSVKDYGSGIPEEFQSRIFEKFAQASGAKGGTGLGLNICKKIIEKFGGDINFKTKVGKGTTFSVILPLIPLPLISKPLVNQTLPRILVCEDDVDVAHFLKELLNHHGCCVDIAFSAAQAEDLLKNYSYDAMTLDLMLPDKDGIKLIRELRDREETKKLPIIVLSARSEEGRKQLNGHAFSVIDWQTKPINEQRLLQALTQSLDTSRRPVILYVEDEPDLVEIITNQFKDIADIIPAPTLAKAKELLAKEHIDLILLDISLPDGSGLKLLENLHGDNAKPVVIFSASEVSKEVSQQVSLAFVKSQVSEEAIVDTIKSFIRV